MADRPEMFWLWVFGDGLFNGTMQNVVRPTLVAMTTKFGLGAEIQSPTGLFKIVVGRFTISEVAADWYELMIPRRIMRPSIARDCEQLDPR